MGKMPSIRTVADHAGVSTATVSNVLNMRRNVAPALAARVRAAVAELGYIADVSAARLRSRRSTIVGIIVPDIANPFFGALVSVIEEEARSAGYELLIVSSSGDCEAEAQRLRSLLMWRPAGVILVPSDNHVSAHAVAQAAGIPVVVADRVPDNPDVDAVGIDNSDAAAAVTRHLVSQGCTDILTVASSLSIGNVRERWDAVEATANGIAHAELIEVGVSAAEARQGVLERLRNAAPLPSAIFTLNNLATMGTLEALALLGVQPGRDVAVAGFDDEEWMRVVTPPLTAVRQPTRDIARATWDRLRARIDGDLDPPKTIRLACRLEIRASSLREEQARASVALRVVHAHG